MNTNSNKAQNQNEGEGSRTAARDYEAGVKSTVKSGNVDAIAIPSDKPSFGAFYALDDLSQKRVHAILEEGAKTAEEKEEVEHGSLGLHGLVPLEPKTIHPAIKPR